VVRQAGPQDLAALSKLARETFRAAFGPSFNASDLALLLEETRSEAYFRKTLHADTVLVALDEGTIVGYVQLSNVTIQVESATDRDQQLSALYVDSAYQGKGIGKLLMDAALDHPRFREARNIYLDVWEDNVKARELYKRFGFEVIGTCDLVVDSRVVGHDLVMVRRATS
jgi:ribosomal protein S18 acetylase RimI-like enzyme